MSESKVMENSDVEYISKVLPETLAELGKMDDWKFALLVVAAVAVVAILRLPEIIKAWKTRNEH